MKKRGYARTAMKDVIDLAREKGVKAVRLDAPGLGVAAGFAANVMLIIDLDRFEQEMTGRYFSHCI